jgi:hypothetical protein
MLESSARLEAVDGFSYHGHPHHTARFGLPNPYPLDLSRA